MSEFFGNPFTNSIVLMLLTVGLTTVLGWLAASRANARQMLRDQTAAAVEAARIIADSHTKLVNEVQDLKERLSLVTAQVVPFSTAFQQILVAQLTHTHTPELDALMAKLGPPITLTEAEETEMYHLLMERQADMGEEITQEEREAALILPYVIKRARAEQAQIAMAEGVRLQMVGVTAMVAVPLSALKQVVPAARGAP